MHWPFQQRQGRVVAKRKANTGVSPLRCAPVEMTCFVGASITYKKKKGAMWIAPLLCDGSGLLFLLCLRLQFGFWGRRIAVAYHVQTHEVGSTGFGTGSGDDADDLARLDVAALFEDLFGHVD
jgi:hypothetical protein